MIPIKAPLPRFNCLSCGSEAMLVEWCDHSECDAPICAICIKDHRHKDGSRVLRFKNPERGERSNPSMRKEVA